MERGRDRKGGERALATDLVVVRVGDVARQVVGGGFLLGEGSVLH